jgi:hypothetical protein
MSDNDAIARYLQRAMEEDQRVDLKRPGAAFVAFAVAWVAAQSMSWWEIAAVFALTYWGLHQIAGIKVNWLS